MIKQILWGMALCGCALAGMAAERKPQPEVGEVPPPMLGKLHGGKYKAVLWSPRKSSGAVRN